MLGDSGAGNRIGVFGTWAMPKFEKKDVILSKRVGVIMKSDPTRMKKNPAETALKMPSLTFEEVLEFSFIYFTIIHIVCHISI